ncbi:MAG: Holliday junction branch migration protein RuvA [Acidimicrobiia bacterium]|nr:Holliday junction branch migration protein RuvA [Acidimicrobiia bacterium]
MRGVLLDRSLDGELLVEVAGVGYRVAVSPATALAIGEVGDEVFLHTHHHLREDTQTLYGFASREARVCFEALLSAHGVGPSLALAILSVHDPAALRQILLDEDVAALCLVPGVGKKTAARLLVEPPPSSTCPIPAGGTRTERGLGRGCGRRADGVDRARLRSRRDPRRAGRPPRRRCRRRRRHPVAGGAPATGRRSVRAGR